MTLSVLSSLFSDVSTIKGIGPKTAQWLRYLCGGSSVLDVLWHLPTNVIHRPFYEKEPLQNQPICIKVKIDEYLIPPVRRRPLKIICQTDFGRLDLVFFHYHQASLTEKFPIGTDVFLSGTIQVKDDFYEMVHPDFMALKKEDIPEFESVYPMSQGKNSIFFNRLVQKMWEKVPNLPEWLDEETLKESGYFPWRKSMFLAHNPRSLKDCSIESFARKRLIFDELLAHQLALKLIRRYHQKQKGISCEIKAKTQLNLPFKLTKAQQKVLDEIYQDLSASYPMNRLLQGDVGSGKTVVALLSALKVIDSGYQSAFMAPTDILARQHYEKISTLLDGVGIKVALLTAKEKGKKRKEILSDLAQGKIQLLIGTHALIEDNVVFKNLALAVVDEQHRFGVNQRLALRQKQKGCNLFVMSATPIPRSLAMTNYGDMDISVLDEKPMGRQPVTTRVMHLSKISQILEKLKQTETQVYWVCPLVKETEKSDLMASEKRFEELKSFGFDVGLVHGKMKADEKENVMRDFKAGKIQILVSTTVIEVGVDVPNANLMIIEHAERFGLATLHQLRGRVGRGNQSAYCVLLHGRLGEKGKERLDILRQTDDGFVISNKDLQMRGAGEVLGVAQSGFQQYRLAQLPEHQDLLDRADRYAQKIMKIDPELEKNKNLRILLYLFERQKAIMTLKAG